METAGVYARESAVLDRPVQIGVASGRLISLSFPDSVPPDAGDDHPLLDRVFDYLDGAGGSFDDVEVALTLPTDRREVLASLRTVPHGRTVSAGKLASLSGLDPDEEADAGTVRAALRENPVPVVVPDHRVRDAPGATPEDVAETLRDLES